MPYASIRLCVAVLGLGMMAATTCGADRPFPATVELLCVDEAATGYATFQSHNQKIVQNQHGIFLAYIRTRNEAYTAQTWRLLWSRDGGKSFGVVHESTDPTNPAVLETDVVGNVYLARPDFVKGDAYLYRFLAKEGFARPHVTPIPGGAAGKFCMEFDTRRGQLYHFAHNGMFHVLGLDGAVRHATRLLTGGKNAVLQYPLLNLDPQGVLHAGWTTQKHGVYMYWDIHFMRSRDGGKSWGRHAGGSLQTPIVADDGGPTPRITKDDEFDSHTWLSSLMAHEGKLHFLYLAQTKPSRQHYVRVDAGTGREEHRVQPKFGGERIYLQGLSGFFAHSPVGRKPRSAVGARPLYAIGNNGGHVGAVVSDDNGTTWRDYARSKESYRIYSIGGARSLTAKGEIIGTFTDQRCSTSDATGTCRVFFFRVTRRAE